MTTAGCKRQGIASILGVTNFVCNSLPYVFSGVWEARLVVLLLRVLLSQRQRCARSKYLPMPSACCGTAVAF